MDCAVPVGASLLAKGAPLISLGNQFIFLKLIFHIFDFSAPVRCRQTVFTQIHKNHFLDSKNALASDLVAHFTSQCDRGAAELGGGVPSSIMSPWREALTKLISEMYLVTTR